MSFRVIFLESLEPSLTWIRERLTLSCSPYPATLCALSRSFSSPQYVSNASSWTQNDLVSKVLRRIYIALFFHLDGVRCSDRGRTAGGREFAVAEHHLPIIEGAPKYGIFLPWKKGRRYCTVVGGIYWRQQSRELFLLVWCQELKSRIFENRLPKNKYYYCKLDVQIKMLIKIKAYYCTSKGMVANTLEGSVIK